MRINFKPGSAWKGRLAVAVTLAALTGLIQISRLGDALANLSYDLLFGLKPVAAPGEVVMIYLDEQASSSLRRDSLLWDRSALARLVDTLRRDGCRLIVFDIWFFDAGSEAGDRALAKAFRDHGGVVIAGVPEEENGSGTARGLIRAPNPMFQTAAAGWGVAGVVGQRDAIVRHYHPGTEQEPSLPAVATSIWFRGLGSTVPRRSMENPWLYYYGGPGVIPGLNYSDALVQRPGFYTGKAVFIGVKNKTPFPFVQNDEFRTPLTLWGKGFLPGVDLAATSFLNHIRGEGLTQVPGLVENLLLMLVALALGVWLPSLPPGRGFVVACGLGLLWLVVALTLAHSQHVWFSWILPAALQPGLLLGWMLFHARSAPGVTATQAQPLEGATPPRISDHTLLRRVGRGAYGEVWLAQDVIGTFKAVKLIHRSSFESDEPFDREFRGMQKFTPLSRAHPGWVHILHVGKEESYFYYVMELGDDERTGQDIVPESYQPRNLAWDLRQRRRLPLDECIEIGIALADALDYLHSQLLVHRDIKPSNVIFVHGVPKFADIGLVTELRNRDRQVSCLGTVGYMAPEGPGTAAADLYSLAKLLYEISTGQAPLQYPASPGSLLAEPGAQRMCLFQAVVDKSCSLDPAKRHQSAAEFRDALRALIMGLALWILTAGVGYGQDNAVERFPSVMPPKFSVPSGANSKPFLVELQASAAQRGGQIRYTEDGSEPTEKSLLYSHALSVTHSVCLKARAFVPGGGMSPVVSQVYTLLADDFQPPNSTLPLVVIYTWGKPIAHRTKSKGAFQIFEPIGGIASLTNKATWRGDLEISLRGNTSLQFPKNSYTVKFVDEQGGSLKVPVAGLPEDSDWVLYAPYFDRTQLRDVLAYDLSNRIGRYAPRTRFVEVFVMDTAGRLTEREYAGVYVLEEKIKRGRNRVNLDAAANANAPTKSLDGYLFKMDHVDPGEKGFRTARGLHFLYVHPKEREITAEQSTWLTQQLNQFESALFGRNFADPNEGYAKFLDVDAFIDHFWLVEMSKNVDGFRFSAYLQWSPGGKLKMGPIWDCDQSFGNANFYGGDSPVDWYWPYIRNSEINWFARLSKDPAFQRRVTDRWLELRRGPFETSRVLSRIDALVADLGDAQKRNSNRWPTRRNYPDYVRQMKRWIQARLEWIDRELPTVSDP